ncbi:hypothetical protein HK103_005057 [Boothiomyces macroporosus]|uniref:Elongation factor methyltransferase 6 n=1 Tax=Boothiomyces macroporosus TaxID=261099 RepID=A0AAD5UJI1_9FUNG|nr:hypothetical protein HK103_005057 [Boothiomyces macroporosus]
MISVPSEGKPESEIIVPTFENTLPYEFEDIKLQYDPTGNLKAGTGATVWDSSFVLLKYLESQFKKGLTKDNLSIIELGAGTGLVGLSLGTMLPNAQITLTDQASVVPLLKFNAENAKLSNVRVEILDWKQPPLLEQYDMIIMSDLITWPELYTPLVNTIDLLSNEETLIVFSHECRSFEKEQKFYQKLSKKFRFKNVDENEQDPVYRSDDLYLFTAKKKCE